MSTRKQARVKAATGGHDPATADVGEAEMPSRASRRKPKRRKRWRRNQKRSFFKRDGRSARPVYLHKVTVRVTIEQSASRIDEAFRSSWMTAMLGHTWRVAFNNGLPLIDGELENGLLTITYETKTSGDPVAELRRCIESLTDLKRVRFETTEIIGVEFYVIVPSRWGEQLPRFHPDFEKPSPDAAWRGVKHVIRSFRNDEHEIEVYNLLASAAQKYQRNHKVEIRVKSDTSLPIERMRAAILVLGRYVEGFPLLEKPEKWTGTRLRFYSEPRKKQRNDTPTGRVGRRLDPRFRLVAKGLRLQPGKLPTREAIVDLPVGELVSVSPTETDSDSNAYLEFARVRAYSAAKQGYEVAWFTNELGVGLGSIPEHERIHLRRLLTEAEVEAIGADMIVTEALPFNTTMDDFIHLVRGQKRVMLALAMGVERANDQARYSVHEALHIRVASYTKRGAKTDRIYVRDRFGWHVRLLDKGTMECLDDEEGEA